MERRAYSLEQVLQDEYLDIVEQIMLEKKQDEAVEPKQVEEVVVYEAKPKILGKDDRIQEEIDDYNDEELLNL